MGRLLLLRLRCILSLCFIAIFFFEVLKFPKSMLLSLAELRIGLLDKNNRRHLDITIILNIIKLHQIDGIEIETQNSVIVVELFSQMGVNDEGSIVVTEV